MNKRKNCDIANKSCKHLKLNNNNKSEYPVIELSDESEVIVKEIDNKGNKNTFANISHKKICGANNWLNFVQTQSPKNDYLSNKPKTQLKQTSSKISSKPRKFKIGTNDLSASHFNCKSGTGSMTTHGSTGSNSKSKAFQPTDPHKKEDCKFKESAVLTKLIAMDCEMVGVDVGVNNNMLARVSLVNSLGECIYDKYVKPTEQIVDYRTHVSGIRPKDLINAYEFEVVQKEVADKLKGRILVGHALKHDLDVLFLTHPKRMMRDTSRFSKFREGKTPALKKLVKKYLGVTIQEGEHSSKQDALAAMQLYMMFRKEWETSLKPIKKNKQKTQDTNSTSEMII